MTAKDYLLQVRKLDASIKRLDLELTRARNELITLRSSWPDGQPHGSGGKSDPVGEKASQLADTITQIEIEQLKHKLYLAEMERDLLKKLEEIERRDAYRK